METFRIAICDDDPVDGDRVVTLCREIARGWDAPTEIALMTSADELRAKLEDGAEGYDAYLLDIQMPGSTGLDLALWLYERGVRNRVIFVTGNPEYALSGYEAHPLHYLLKPVSRESLAAALELAQSARAPQTARFQRGGKTVSLPVADIRYLESRDHGVQVCLAGGEGRYFSVSLNDAELAMPAGTFARCHKSYLVNLAWVEESGRTGLVLRDGERLPVSRTFQRDFQAAFVRWLNRGGA